MNRFQHADTRAPYRALWAAPGRAVDGAARTRDRPRGSDTPDSNGHWETARSRPASSARPRAPRVELLALAHRRYISSHSNGQSIRHAARFFAAVDSTLTSSVTSTPSVKSFTESSVKRPRILHPSRTGAGSARGSDHSSRAAGRLPRQDIAREWLSMESVRKPCATVAP